MDQEVPLPPSRIERRSIDVIPDAERHGSPLNQFTLWFGANMQITAIVDGALPEMIHPAGTMAAR